MIVLKRSREQPVGYIGKFQRLGRGQSDESAHVGKIALVLLASAFVGGTGFCAD
jgi:hypothetical protein